MSYIDPRDPRLVEYAQAWMRAKTFIERFETVLWCVLNPEPPDWPHGATEWAYYCWWQDNGNKH